MSTNLPTTSPHALRLNEFREASAAVRHAHTADAEAHETQIMANHRRVATTATLKAANERFEKAAEDLAAARTEPQPAASTVDDLDNPDPSNIGRNAREPHANGVDLSGGGGAG